MELIKFSISVLIMLLVWGAWRRSSLDSARDRLFDMRGELRTWFIENGYGLDHVMYADLRKLLNAHLRFTEDIRFIGMLWFSVRIPQSVSESIQNDLNAKYHTNDKRLNAFAGKIRHNSARAMQIYMMETSTLFMIVVALSLPFAILAAIKNGIQDFWKNLKSAIARRLDETVARPGSLEAAAILQMA